MNIWHVIILIGFVSVILSVISLKSLSDESAIRQAKKKLSKGRIVFQDPSASNK